MNVILSIKPKYAEAILSGEKKYEFRKSSFPPSAKVAIIYSSNHVGKIVGWFKIIKQIRGKPLEIWKIYHENSRLTKEEFLSYYSSSKTAVCLVIGSVHRLDPPIDPYETIKHFLAPQSYRYIKKTDYLGLNDKIDVLRNLKLDSFSKAIG
jgi:predicted transcriptional regulator